MNSMDGDDPLDWREDPISVVSLGVAGYHTLSLEAKNTLIDADLIVGADHHFEKISALNVGKTIRKTPYPSPLANIRQLLHQHQSRKIAVLASGDALFYGIGSLLIKLVGRKNLAFYGNISSVGACFHAVGIPWQDAKVVSLHGRPLSTLRRYLAPNTLLAIFTDHSATPLTIATEMVTLGYGQSSLWICEDMGGEHQTITASSAHELTQL